MNWRCNFCQREFEIPDEIEKAACPVCGTPVVLPEDVCEEEAPAEDIRLAGPWTRFAARLLIDLTPEQLAASFIFFFCLKLAGCSDAFALFLNYLLVCPLALFLDSIIYAIFGNTLGKWLTCVRHVDASNGQKISAGRYFVRNIQVFFSGFGLDIPIVKMITFILQYLRVSRGESTSYDEKAGVITVEVNQSIKKRLLAWAVIIVFQVLLFAFFWYAKHRG